MIPTPVLAALVTWPLAGLLVWYVMAGPGRPAGTSETGETDT